MGTRSTVKFYENGENILSVYQQYDGYPEGVGEQIVKLLKKYEIVNGLPVSNMAEEITIANGLGELALFYILDNKDKNGNIYATTESNTEEFNYEIYSIFKDKSVIERINVYHYDELIFHGTPEEFYAFVEEYC